MTASAIPIVRYAKITPSLSRGGRLSKAGVRYLKQTGVEQVIDLRSRFIPWEAAMIILEKYRLNKAGISHKNVPLSSVFSNKQNSVLKVFKLINSTPDSNKKTFIHCLRGRDRTSLISTLYAVLNQGMPTGEALQTQAFKFGHKRTFNTRSILPDIYRMAESLKKSLN